MKKLKKNVKGVTMVALVVTIIILLILATVTIGLTIGKNGIFSRGKTATDEHIKQEAKEAMNLKITGIQIECYTEKQTLPDLQYLADKLCEDTEMDYVLLESKKEASLDKIDVKDVNSIFTKIKKYPYEFEIDSELKLASVDGVKIAEDNNTQDDGWKKEIELQIKALQEDNRLLKEDNKKLQEDINKLANEKTSIVREKLTSNNFTGYDVPLTNGVVNKNFGDIKLIKSIEDYKYIEFQVDIKNSSGLFGNKTNIIAVNHLNYNSTNTDNWYNQSIFILELASNGSQYFIDCWFKDKETMHIGTACSNSSNNEMFTILEIYGIK